MRRHAVALLCTLAMIGCTAEEEGADTAYEEAHQTAQVDEGFSTQEPTPPTPWPDSANQMTLIGNVVGMRGGAIGSATLRTGPRETQVQLNINEFTPGTELQAGIFTGSCAATGEQVAPLGALEAGQARVATLSGTAPVPADRIADGRHALVVYLAEQGGVVNVGCMEIPDRSAWQGAPGR